MSKKKQTEDEVIVDIGGSYNKAEEFIENNKQMITAVIVGIIVIVGGYFGYTKMYLDPLQMDAEEQIWKAQSYLDKDSLDLAMFGDGNYMGFEEIASEFSGTRAGDLANYYMGVISLRKEEFDLAIDYLDSYSGNDIMLSAIALGAIGDANMELDDAGKALDYYKKAARKNPNDFTSAIFLMKAGKVAEALEDYSDAVGLYEEIKKNYPDTKEGREVEKYLARAKTLASK
ncbi:MAG: tetratricopeptide repeat protein [Flavobacteriales bacterium]|jgi:tetratricopeptide (TPR) repeat protein